MTPTTDSVEQVKTAIVNLINAKLYDVLSTPGGLMRLVANRTSGVSSPDIRAAERQLRSALNDMVNERNDLGEGVGAVAELLRH